jgi:aspartyl/asparaginyl-tRNA synthetase
VQVVAPNTLPNYADEVLKLTTGCAIEATGMIVPSPAKGQLFEMQASAIRVVGWVDDPDTYPIQPKPHSLEFLRGVDHREVRRRRQPKRPAVREPTDRHDRRRQQWQAAPELIEQRGDRRVR